MPPYYYQEKAFVQTANSRTRTARPARHIILYKQNNSLNHRTTQESARNVDSPAVTSSYQQIVDAKRGE
jgi:hypothetical protein